MEYVSTRIYALLRGCSERYVRGLIGQGKLIAEEIDGKGGDSGRQYRIPLASIEPKYIKKWKRIQAKESGVQDPPKEKTVPVPLNLTVENLSMEEREEVTRWKRILEDWQTYRNRAPGKKKADEEYVAYLTEQYPDMKFSPRILSRKWDAMNGQGDMALRDGRGKHGNHAKAIPDAVFDIFEY